MNATIPLRYKDRRLEGETTLRQCQFVQLHLLHVFDRICKENHLTYFLGGGTLLGAMRHKGFIPWDDDIDVGMPMKDYRRFLKIAKTALPKDVILHLPSDTPKCRLPYAKLRDAYSFFYEMRPDCPTTMFLGIFIDIFPYEEMPEIGRLGKLLMLKGIDYSWMLKKVAINKITSFGLRGCAFFLLSGLGGLLYAVLRSLFVILQTLLPCKYSYLQLEADFPYSFETKTLYPTKTAIFEDGEFPIPNDPDAFLTSQYGNWRETPAPDRRPRHAKIILPTTAQDHPMAMPYPMDKRSSQATNDSTSIG